MAITLKISCGCGFIAEANNQHIKDLRSWQRVYIDVVLKDAQQHCAETGHTMEILGAVQP